jgi:hypothetical protein
VATFVAAVSHALGGDAPPSWLGVLASFVLSLSVCTALAGRSPSWLRLAASVAVSQLLFHGLFSGLGAPVAVSGHAHDAVPVHGAVVVHDAAALGAPAAMTGHDERMLLAHVIAGILTLLALRFGERAFWSIVEGARLVVERLLPVSVPVGAAPARVILPALASVLGPRTIHVDSTHRHRGPPLQFASIQPA